MILCPLTKELGVEEEEVILCPLTKEKGVEEEEGVLCPLTKELGVEEEGHSAHSLRSLGWRRRRRR